MKDAQRRNEKHLGHPTRQTSRPAALDADKQKAVAALLGAARANGEDPNFGAIGRSVSASERTIRRFAGGSYDRSVQK